MAQYGFQSSLLLLMSMMLAVAVARISPTPYNPPTLALFEKLDPKAPEVVDAGKFAIQEHNRIDSTNLQFREVARAQQELVSAGADLSLVIGADKENGDVAYFLAHVLRALDATKTLESFVELHLA
ncbi:OLC1v1005998C1 [Oldenlandia corymbosa var. corymbosa]|uniref:OLC1v1005998C1 n=1 Tax=Oldenlandia corymbosa var. corymbosa TaxID=529605 RepID=A0AAV1DIF1_OLDCO|nr:OLC1v1005998C1 [Oldenlandia corymbosa var. corymbosa]